MKVVFLVKYYDLYQDHLRSSIADFNTKTYDELIEEINSDYFLMYSSFIVHLRKLGHEAHLIIPNLKELQTKWAAENITNAGDNSGEEIALAQIEQHQPDILFLNSNFEYWGSFAQRASAHCKKICAWLSCPFEETLSFDHIDHLYTLFPPHYDYLKNRGLNVTMTQAGFDADILNNVSKSKEVDFSFVGGIGGHHKKRMKYLSALAKATELQLWGYGFKSENVIKNIVKQGLTKFRFTKNYHGEAWGLDMYNILHNSKIVFNSHGDIAGDFAVNMRMFEATGMGALLLTENSKNIKDFFEAGKEVITYDSVEDAIEKVKYYLSHEDERAAIAKAGQERTLRDHNYGNIVKEYLQSFESLLTQ